MILEDDALPVRAHCLADVSAFLAIEDRAVKATIQAEPVHGDGALS
jgi:hypothetical protein